MWTEASWGIDIASCSKSVFVAGKISTKSNKYTVLSLYYNYFDRFTELNVDHWVIIEEQTKLLSVHFCCWGDFLWGIYLQECQVGDYLLGEGGWNYPKEFLAIKFIHATTFNQYCTFLVGNIMPLVLYHKCIELFKLWRLLMWISLKITRVWQCTL